MLKQKKAKFTLILIFTIFFPLLIQNSQGENDGTNHNKEYKALLKKAIDMHKLLNKLKKERKQDKEEYKESQKTMIRKLQRWYVPIITNQSQKKTIKPSSLEESKKKIKKLSLYGIKNTQTQSVRQLRTLPYPQVKPTSLSNSISLRSRINNFTLKLPKISETKSLYKPLLPLEYKNLVIKKNDLLYRLTNLQRKIKEVIAKCTGRYIYQHKPFNCEHFSRELNSIMESLKIFDMKLGSLISEITGTGYSELSYEELKQFSQRTQDLENYYKANISKLINKIAEKVKKIDNLILRLEDLEKLLPIIARGGEPYSYLSLEERRTLYQNFCHEYEEIINELGQDKSFFLFYKAFPEFVFEKTQVDTRQNKLTKQEQTALLIKKLASLLILANRIDSIIKLLTNMKNLIASNLSQSDSDIISGEEAKNCKNWREELEKDQWKNLIAFDEKGEIKFKDDFLFFSDKRTLDEITKKIEVCTGILPEKTRKLCDGLTFSKNGITVPITTYEHLFGYINTNVAQLLEDIERTNEVSIYYKNIAATISRILANLPQVIPNREVIAIERAMKVVGLDEKRIECTIKNITKIVSYVGDVTGKEIEQAFEKCNIIFFSSLTKNPDEILKLSVKLFNSCFQVYLEDIHKLIKFRYDVFVKTFNLLWDKFLFASSVKDNFLSGENYVEWYDTYSSNCLRQKDNYVCIIRLYQYALDLLEKLCESELNKNLLAKLCLDEIEVMNLEKEVKRNLRNKFEHYLKHGVTPLEACRIIKIYQKGIEINKIDDINQRVKTISDKEISPYSR